MKINWKLRFQNKVTLTAIIVAIIALVYQVCNMLGITPDVAQSELLSVVSMIIDVLVLLGVVVDPTTAGVGDSVQAQSYNSPKQS